MQSYGNQQNSRWILLTRFDRRTFAFYSLDFANNSPAARKQWVGLSWQSLYTHDHLGAFREEGQVLPTLSRSRAFISRLKTKRINSHFSLV
ncbi:unnamed protein product [Schistosoma rodhaini]|nr:unnamed protein product [Schistosoma rodhaini]